jgi:glucose/arabinose dehydrogenase
VQIMRAGTAAAGLSVLVLLAGCGSGDDSAAPTPTAPGTTAASSTAAPPAAASPTAASPTAVTPAVISSGLQVPWGLAFLPDGSALVSERETARIHQVRPDGRRTVVATVPGVEPRGEAGLLGLAVSPSYASDGWVYAYYTGASDNRVVRFRLDTPGTQQVLVGGIPKAGNHNGGRLAFGPDGMLYAGTGDAASPSRAQDKGSLGGKVLRLKPTGGAADGNPFGSPVWSLGHRNVQGLAFDDAGRLWASEFGQNTYDEVNLIVRGGNYGWPEVEGRGTGGGRYVSPQVVWSTSEASPSGVAFAGGALHVAALRGERLWDVPLSGARAGSPTARYRGSYGRIRSATTEPGGRALWLTTSNCDGRGDCPARQDLVIRVPL